MSSLSFVSSDSLISFSERFAHEDQLAAPEHVDDLAFLDRRQVDLEGRTGGDHLRIRGHGSHEGPGQGTRAHGETGSGRQEQEVAAGPVVT